MKTKKIKIIPFFFSEVNVKSLGGNFCLADICEELPFPADDNKLLLL